MATLNPLYLISCSTSSGKKTYRMAGVYHYFWHFNNYLNWDEPWYGGFRESQSDLRMANQRFYESNYMPNMLGWFLVTLQIGPVTIEAGQTLVVSGEKTSSLNDRKGELIRTLAINDGMPRLDPGRHTLSFDGTPDLNSPIKQTIELKLLDTEEGLLSRDQKP